MVCLYCGSHNIRVFSSEQFFPSPISVRTEPKEHTNLKECLDCGNRF